MANSSSSISGLLLSDLTERTRQDILKRDEVRRAQAAIDIARKEALRAENREITHVDMAPKNGGVRTYRYGPSTEDVKSEKTSKDIKYVLDAFKKLCKGSESGKMPCYTQVIGAKLVKNENPILFSIMRKFMDTCEHYIENREHIGERNNILLRRELYKAIALMGSLLGSQRLDEEILEDVVVEDKDARVWEEDKVVDGRVMKIIQGKKKWAKIKEVEQREEFWEDLLKIRNDLIKLGYKGPTERQQKKIELEEFKGLSRENKIEELQKIAVFFMSYIDELGKMAREEKENEGFEINDDAKKKVIEKQKSVKETFKNNLVKARNFGIRIDELRLEFAKVIEIVAVKGSWAVLGTFLEHLDKDIEELKKEIEGMCADVTTSNDPRNEVLMIILKKSLLDLKKMKMEAEGKKRVMTTSKVGARKYDKDKIKGRTEMFDAQLNGKGIANLGNNAPDDAILAAIITNIARRGLKNQQHFLNDRDGVVSDRLAYVNDMAVAYIAGTYKNLCKFIVEGGIFTTDNIAKMNLIARKEFVMVCEELYEHGVDLRLFVDEKLCRKDGGDRFRLNTEIVLKKQKNDLDISQINSDPAKMERDVFISTCKTAIDGFRESDGGIDRNKAYRTISGWTHPTVLPKDLFLSGNSSVAIAEAIYEKIKGRGKKIEEEENREIDNKREVKEYKREIKTMKKRKIKKEKTFFKRKVFKRKAGTMEEIDTYFGRASRELEDFDKRAKEFRSWSR